jgi:hypothetical protein
MSGLFFFFFFFFFFAFLQLMRPEAPQLYGLLYYPRIGFTTFSSSTLPRFLSRESCSCNPAILDVSNFRH